MYNEGPGKEQALQKARHYCAYQERSHAEVREKLYGYGLYKTEVEEILATLIEENYLNEERFAIAFAGGKFRMKQWGRIKIKQELKRKGVSPYCIRKGLASIPDEDYRLVLEKTAAKKLLSLKGEKNSLTRKKKLQDHLLQKGYETDLVYPIINTV